MVTRTRVDVQSGREVTVHPHNTHPKPISVYTARTHYKAVAVATVLKMVRMWQP